MLQQGKQRTYCFFEFRVCKRCLLQEFFQLLGNGGITVVLTSVVKVAWRHSWWNEVEISKMSLCFDSSFWQSRCALHCAFLQLSEHCVQTDSITLISLTLGVATAKQISPSSRTLTLWSTWACLVSILQHFMACTNRKEYVNDKHLWHGLRPPCRKSITERYWLTPISKQTMPEVNTPLCEKLPPNELLEYYKSRISNAQCVLMTSLFHRQLWRGAKRVVR